MTKILLVEDEESFREGLSFMLSKEGYEVITAEDGNVAITKFEQHGADLVLLDVMLPGLSGLDVCKKLRTLTKVPIIMLTAKDTELDKVLGLEIGADDYITKPFSSRELLARVKAILRRVGGVEEKTSVLEIGPVRVDTERHLVTVDSVEQSLPLKEFDLLVSDKNYQKDKINNSSQTLWTPICKKLTMIYDLKSELNETLNAHFS